MIERTARLFDESDVGYVVHSSSRTESIAQLIPAPPVMVLRLLVLVVASHSVPQLDVAMA